MLLPAPGLPQTVYASPQLRGLLKRCRVEGLHTAPTPQGPALAAFVFPGGATLVLIGGPVDQAALDRVTQVLPLTVATLEAESAAALATSQVEIARAGDRRSQQLAIALNATGQDLQRALDEAARLNAELALADRHKDEFLAMLGHELRNPMAAICSALELLRKQDNPRAREIIGRHAQQLTRLIDDLLDVARISGGQIGLKLQPLEVNEIVRRAVEVTAPAVSAKGHLLEVSGGPLWILADPTRLEQMITNLLINAAKYTNPGGQLSVSTRREANEALIRVKDNGLGIAPDKLPRVFDLFMQIAPGIERSGGGLGIGLSLVARLAALHKGKVEARSELGKGSEFVLRFAAIDAPPRPAPAPPPSLTSLRPKRVLVVDDNVDLAQTLSEIVLRWGHETQLAHDGLKALEVAEQFKPNVVLLDLGLPGLDGYEVARRLRQLEITRRARIVSVSGFGLQADRERSKAAGFDEHFVKPVDLAVLRKSLES